MTTMYVQPVKALDVERDDILPANSDFSFSLSVSVNADRRRVFHLLTIAEYIETWLCIPGIRQESQLQVASDSAGFRIQYCDQTGLPKALVGTYQTCRTSKTQFFWKRMGFFPSQRSLVRIRLNGDFERTTLCLSHRGLSSNEDCDWHSEFWSRSLSKLSALFELSRTGPSVARDRD